MAKRFLYIVHVLVLAGCVATGNPWDRSPGQPAVAAPSALSRDAFPEQHPAARPAGFEMGGPSGTAVPAGAPVFRERLTAPDASDNTAGGAFLPPSVKVALLVPLTGPHRELGQAMLQAAQMALFDMNYESFELLPRDTAAGAEQAARDAVANGAQLILGPLFADDVRAVQPVVQRYNLNMIAFSTDWSLAGGPTFVMGFLPFTQVSRIAGYALEKGYGNVGILAPESDYGNAVVASWNAYLYRAGQGATAATKFQEGQSDVSGIVRRFARYDERTATAQKGSAATPQGDPPYSAVLLPVGGEQARAVASMLSYYGLPPRQVKRISTGLWDDPGLAAEPALAGAWFAAPSPELRRGFEQKYAALYGQPAPRLSTLAYDATALAAVLARSGFAAGGQPAYDRQALTNPNGFAGIDGIFRFRPDGLVERGLAVLEFRNGQIVEIDPAPRTFENHADRYGRLQ